MELRVSLVQMNPKSGDLIGNSRRIVAALQEAAQRQVDLVVFPELALTGYCLDEKLLINRQFLKENKQLLLEKVVSACQATAAIVGFVDFDEVETGPDRHLVRYNAAAVIQDGRLLQIVHKRLLPAYRYFDDKRYFRAGRTVEPVSVQTATGQVPIGVLICEDLWDEKYDSKPSLEYVQKGARYLFCINASPFVAPRHGQQDGKRHRQAELIRHRVEDLGVPIVYLNTVGVGDNGKNIIPFDGNSFAYDRAGTLVAALPSFQEARYTIDFDGGRASGVQAGESTRESNLYDALVMSVRDYYDKIGIFEGILEAVSGGIDSALGAAVAVAAVGAGSVTLYNLPSRYNSGKTQENARRLAQNLGADYKVIPIQEMIDKVVSDFESHLHRFQEPVSLENLQARIRGLIMMSESNDRQALLLTNGNETEMALGYATLYGDMVGGLAVIGDLSKPDVYRLARYVNEREGREVIPAGTFDVPASAELRSEQVDPFDYDIVGPIVSRMVEAGQSPAELASLFESGELSGPEFPARMVREYDSESFLRLCEDLYGQLNRSVYKRMQAAPIIVVSERAFGFDLRETIINGWSPDQA